MSTYKIKIYYFKSIRILVYGSVGHRDKRVNKSCRIWDTYGPMTMVSQRSMINSKLCTRGLRMEKTLDKQ